jgi:hypothetical protein
MNFEPPSHAHSGQPLSAHRLYLLAAAAILGITGLAKLLTLTGSTTLLKVADPIFGISFHLLLLAVGILEIAIAGFCLFSRRHLLSTAMVASIASSFLAYRAGASFTDWKRPCGCLGNLTDVLHLSPQAADAISIGMLGFLLIGSYGFLMFGRVGAHPASSSTSATCTGQKLAP